MSELNAIGNQIAIATGLERFRLTKHLKRTKYQFRKDNWKLFITDIIRDQNTWKLAKSMSRNDTILNRRKANNKVVDDRNQTVQMWKD